MAMEGLCFTCDLCGRLVDAPYTVLYLGASGDVSTPALVFHQLCANKVAGAVSEARQTGAATLVKP